MKENKIIEEIAQQVQDEFGCSGLADGIYLDFATEVSKRYHNKKLTLQGVVEPFYCAAESVNDPRCKNQCFNCGDEEMNGI